MKINSCVQRVLAVAMMFFTLAVPFSKATTPQFIFVGTGGVTGVYYPAGTAICRVVNKSRKQTGIRCSVESTPGSVANLNSIGDGEFDLAVAQSDMQHHAYHGTSVFKTLGGNTNLRSVFVLHAETFTVVARAGSGIRKFDDLIGKRVNIGNPGSGQRETMEILMRAKGWKNSDFKPASELSSVKQSSALCNNKIDAFVFSVGHPAGSLKQAANSCDVTIISVAGPAIDKLVAKSSFYSKTVVPGGMYRGNRRDVTTIGVAATVSTSADTAADTIYLVVKSVFENLDAIKKMHPALTQLDRTKMVATNPEIPIHEGALRYFKKVGLK